MENNFSVLDLSKKVEVSGFYVKHRTKKDVIQFCVEAVPSEAIGLLWADQDGVVVAHQPLLNSASSHRNEARVLNATFEQACGSPPQEGLRVQGLYHSHVDGPAILSRADKALFGRFDALWVISVRKASECIVAGFRQTSQGAIVFCPVISLENADA